MITWEMVIVGAIRVAGSLPVLRWAFAGAILAILIDFSDLFWMNLLTLGGLGDYQAFDKWIDLVYMVTFLIVALRWSGIEKKVGVGLFAFRMVGIAVFEIVQWRSVLLIFPNVFEFWFVFVAGRNRFFQSYQLNRTRTGVWLFILLLAKEGQEFVLHQGKYLDRYRAVDVVIDWWNWLARLF
ncbi:MAG: hypothetical protein HY682_12120 [Chloroflexi bacterium]|nr:hypothetical protein [Chloroflexota bacterium]